MSCDFFVNLFEYPFCLPVFEDHPSHLNVEFVVYLCFHALIHGLHELLNNVLDIVNVLVVVDPLLKALVDAHDLWIPAEGGVV